MSGYDVVLKVRQIPQTHGLPPLLEEERVCEFCGLRVSKVITNKYGKKFARHLGRLPNGRKCPHGQSDFDPPNSQYAF